VRAERTNTQLEESQKMDSLRRLYQRAIEIPMHNVEAIWREYDQFENGLNKQLAKALMNEHAPRYMGARSTFRERKNYIEGLSRNALARPPRGLQKEMHQVRLWKRLVDYEKKNPQRLDPEALRERVTFTYNQCLMCLYHYPEIWHQSAQFQLECGYPDHCEKSAPYIFDLSRLSLFLTSFFVDVAYQRALQAQPESLLLTFQYCDFLELNGKVEDARTIYNKMLEQQPESLVFVQHLRFSRRVDGVQGARKAFFKARKSPKCTYHVYVAAAMIEYYMNKDEAVARNMLELGSKKFGNDMAFVMQYIDFLFHRNEENGS
jgi:cleavage stimulation factor subunit 3